ncbi:MAG: DinB family protein [Blastocatellia bacterium]
MEDSVLRSQLVGLLQGGEAHVKADAALANINPRFRGARPARAVHSIWEELEHMRIAQEDILRYALDPSWRSPEWPEGYWPAEADSVNDEIWNRSIEAFFSDLADVVKLAKDSNIDLTAQFPHGEGKTYLRQILLVADHNAYHLGQIVQARKLLGDWRE